LLAIRPQPAPIANVDPEIHQENEMNKPLKSLLLISLCFTMIGNAGCTTMQTVHGSQEALAEKRIRVGDKVTLHYTSGHSEEAKLTAIGPESISAITEDGRTIEVEYDHLLSLDHEKVEVLKTAGATVGVVALGAVLVGAVAVGSMVAVAGGM
jgi:hypothetical protein